MRTHRGGREEEREGRRETFVSSSSIDFLRLLIRLLDVAMGVLAVLTEGVATTDDDDEDADTDADVGVPAPTALFLPVPFIRPSFVIWFPFCFFLSEQQHSSTAQHTMARKLAGKEE